MSAPNPSAISPPAANLPPPRNEKFTLAQLKRYNGTQPGVPIYVSIKGTVFDVTSKGENYAAGGSYHVFAGTDGSRGLGMSSLKPEDATSDWSGLPDKDKKVLSDWFEFFKKRYPIVGTVSDIRADLKA